jgi:hypothetical protein
MNSSTAMDRRLAAEHAQRVLQARVVVGPHGAFALPRPAA